MQVPGGILADRFGVRRVLVAALLVWSLFTGLTALAASAAGPFADPHGAPPARRR